MAELTKGKATICVVNYKTLEFTRLCLRSIRKFTKFPYEMIVVDCNSQDESLEYLKSLSWIRLLSRDSTNDRTGGHSHGAALDLALRNCNNEFFVSLHSDTFIQKSGWLGELISYFKDDPKIACVGSGKIEMTPPWRVFLKKATDFRTFKRKLLHRPDPLGKYRYYNRTICCLYRTEVLHRENLTFLMQREKNFAAGKKLYFELLDRGYKTVELSPHLLTHYVVHLAHATQAVNLAEFPLRKKTIRKCHRLIEKVLSSEPAVSILQESSLDH